MFYMVSLNTVLMSITVPSTITFIGYNHLIPILKFHNSFYIFNSGDSAFSDCSSLSQLYFTNGLKIIGNSMFFTYSPFLSPLTIVSTVTFIGNSAFMSCRETQVILTDGLSFLSAYMFQNNGWLTSITIPSTITFIGKYFY